MLINEVSKLTNLTKKAIDYYAEQGLICPVVSDNGYRHFSEGNIELLKKIAVLRKLGLNIEEIRMVLADRKQLKKLSIRRHLAMKKLEAQQAILDRLSADTSYSQAEQELCLSEKSSAVAERLLDAFPGYYGRFICLHFARFLGEPIQTDDQQKAYKEITDFLDNIPPLPIPEELLEYFEQNTRHINNEDIATMLEGMKKSTQDIQVFLRDNREVLDMLVKYKQSEEYKNSPEYKLQSMLKEFNKNSGYYDIFIPAMKKLSPSYSEYCNRLEEASAQLIESYPEISEMNS